MALSRSTQLAAVVSICAASATLIAPAWGKSRRAETFRGTCEMRGEIRNDPPLTTTPRETRFRGSFRGVCSGRLIDRKGRSHRLEDAPATYDGRGEGELSCLGGVSRGTGKLGFGRGRVIRFSLTERRTPGVAAVTLRGRAGGSGAVLGTVSKDADLAELNRQCMGAGVALLRGDARVTSPGISG